MLLRSEMCIASIGLLLLLDSVVVAATKESRSDLLFLKVLKTEHSFCRDRVDLNVSNEYFVEISNPLPGKENYNALIRIAKEKKLSPFEEGFKAFQNIFPSSPLREPLSFLKVDLMFRLAQRPSELEKAEKSFREVSLLYPKSGWLPIVYATAAANALLQGKSEKSLGLFETAVRSFPGHSLRCIFRLGAAESRMLSGQLDEAKQDYRYVKENCRNPTLAVGAELRLIDVKFRSGDDSVEKEFDSLVSNRLTTIQRLYHGVFHNIGEVKFRKNKWSESEYYFRQYLKQSKSTDVCRAQARKRLADIKFETSSSVEDITKAYLEAWEKAKDTDPGRFSYLHALILSSTDVSPAEFLRRLKLVEENSPDIHDPTLRELIHVESAVSRLSRGDEKGFKILLQLTDKVNLSLKDGPLGNYIRDQLLDMLIAGATRGSAGPKNRTSSATLQSAYGYWLAGTKDADKARRLVSKIVLEEYDRIGKEFGPERAFHELSTSMETNLWSAESLSEESQNRFLEVTIAPLYTSGKPGVVASLYDEKKDRIKAILGEKAALLRLGVAYELRNKEEMNKELATLDVKAFNEQLKKMTPENQVYLRAVASKGFAEIGEYQKADALFAKVDRDLASLPALEMKFDFYLKNKSYSKAIETGSQRMFSAKENAEKRQIATSMVEIIHKSKQWLTIPIFQNSLTKNKMATDFQSEIQALNALSEFEKGLCKQANARLKPIMKNKTVEMSLFIEARFKYGKCLSQLGSRTEAIRQWKMVADSKDEFWASLAKSEIETRNQP